VLDTNVWLDWLVFEDPAVEPLRAAHARRALDIAGSAALRAELAHVLARPALRERAAVSRARRALAAPLPEADRLLATYDTLVRACADAVGCALECRDPDDQPFLDLAVARQARWLLTRDRALLRLARAARARFGLAIVPPAAFAPPPPL
jgi:putative PIN family toxin of toxin-antitoxin system